jgi:hypothetical protein
MFGVLLVDSFRDVDRLRLRILLLEESQAPLRGDLSQKYLNPPSERNQATGVSTLTPLFSSRDDYRFPRD